MSGRRLTCGYVPLVDCAPLVIAREMGFAAAEGLDLALHRCPSWSALRDRLALGHVDAAHLLAPMPIAMSMELGGLPTRVDVLSVLSVNGTTIGVSREVAAAMQAMGGIPDFLDATGVGKALIAACPPPLRVGIPFPFSMHAELLYYWLGSLGVHAPEGLIVRSIPPSRMSEAVSGGEIDAFCVGEPWGTVAVEAGAARLILPGAAIWQFAPEKVLAARHDWIGGNPGRAASLLRAVWRAGRWLSDPAHRIAAAEILGSADYLNVSPELIERSLHGTLTISPEGGERHTPRFLEFFDGAATFPWRSQAVWIATRLAGRLGLDRAEAARVARDCFRPDLYRAVLGPAGADLPSASEKLEGALAGESALASSAGGALLGPDTFFDGRVFDPDAII